MDSGLERALLTLRALEFASIDAVSNGGDNPSFPLERGGVPAQPHQAGHVLANLPWLSQYPRRS